MELLPAVPGGAGVWAWAGGGGGALVAAAVALAAARATAYGIDHAVEARASHLDLLTGLLSSWSACLVLLVAWVGMELGLGLGVVLGEMEPEPLLPALLHVLDADPAAASAAGCCTCC